MWKESFIANDAAVLSRADIEDPANAEFLRRAAALAAKRKPPSGDMYSIRAGFRHYSRRDNCHDHWARAVWRPHCGRWRWQYFGGRLPAVKKRKDYVLGVVWPGEIVAQYGDAEKRALYERAISDWLDYVERTLGPERA